MTILITCSVRKSLPFPAEYRECKANVGGCPSMSVGGTGDSSHRSKGVSVCIGDCACEDVCHRLTMHERVFITDCDCE